MFLVLAPSVPGVCLDGVPALWSSTDVPRCGRGGSTVPRPPICSLLPSLAPFAPVAWVMGGVSSPPCLHLSLRFSLACCGRSRCFAPLGKLCHSGCIGALWRLDSSTHSAEGPPGFSATLEASQDPSLSPTPGDSSTTPEVLCPSSSPRTPKFLPAYFPRLPPDFPLCAGLAPWRPHARIFCIHICIRICICGINN